MRRRSRSEDFYAVTPAADYALGGDELTFTSAIETPHPANNLVRARWFPGYIAAAAAAPCSCSRNGIRMREDVGLCRLLNRFGISALRLSMPYHDARMPPELTRADYIVSASVGTPHKCAARLCSMRGVQSRGSTRRATPRSAFSAPASDRACRC